MPRVTMRVVHCTTEMGTVNYEYSGDSVQDAWNGLVEAIADCKKQKTLAVPNVSTETQSMATATKRTTTASKTKAPAKKMPVNKAKAGTKATAKAGTRKSK